MTVYYRDAGGIVAARLSDGESGISIDFCDGYAYFTIQARDDLEDMKIPVSALLRVER